MELGDRILYLLYEQDISQKQLAVDLKIATSTLSGYINNRRAPDYDTLLKIANRLDVSCDFLMGNLPKKDPLDFEFKIDRDDLLVLKYYRQMNGSQQEFIKDLLKLMQSKNCADTTPV